jgi:hypothetical protein
MPRLSRLLSAAVLTLAAAGAAASDPYSWRDHETTSPFLFGNEFDTHQQTRITRDGTLSGFLYIRFTGRVTSDRYRVATHADCTRAHDCTAGWTLHGKPLPATFLYHPMHDHPVFLVNRSDITQPGSPRTFTGWGR